MRNALLSFISLSLAMTAQAANTHSKLRLDRAEVQRFEQSYETWVQSIIHHVLPKTNVSVLIEFSYSTNPELVQNYEEQRAADHLPGLPDVRDLSDSHPTENPLFELVDHQNVKVIFDRQATDDQVRILKEILEVKLNLNTAQGDQISFDQLHRGSDYSGNIIAALVKNGRFAAIFIFLTLAGTAVFFLRKNRRKSLLKETAEKEVSVQYSKVNPISSILKTDAKLLISVIRSQEIGFLVQVMAHAPIQFNQIILQIFEEEARKELFDAYQTQRLNVSRKKSRYSQLLLAAKLHDELKIKAMQQVDTLNDVGASIAEYRMKMQESLNELKALYESNARVQTGTEEVSNETSL